MVALSPPARAVPLPGLTFVLWLVLVAAALLALTVGPSGVSLHNMLADLLAGREIALRDWVVLTGIRLPRLLAGMLVGAGLAVSGAVMQGLFRNPLADPSVVGVTMGAGLGAVAAIVLGGSLPIAVGAVLGTHLVPVAAFLGGWAVVLILSALSRRGGQVSIATMLLAGIALTALAGALTGLLVQAADDAQLRDITFWNLGSLSGIGWDRIALVAPLILPVVLLAPRLGQGLNAMALGEAAALHMGIAVDRLKRQAVLAVALATGGAVAMAGAIGFVGIIVPHLLRLVSGPDHRPLLPRAAVLGAAVLTLADVLARIAVLPAELPIGIVTACLGAPVFLWVLLRRAGLGDA
ncbi:FecCD family ABC transporter permease [Gemmobacter denitrificans]|uniref:Iron ABC transporter permease n=1 Tax=Gemmobacter denitrificans TaxID=3123040 RepID=A0ABU8C0Y1_9RHOB